MNARSAQFAYLGRNGGVAPFIPLTLAAENQLDVFALVDSGAALNVLPYSIGEQLGLKWDEQSASLNLGGYYSSIEARAIVLDAIVLPFPSVRLAFGWARSDAMPIILGQVNFFMEFDVCFFRSRLVIEVRPKTI